MSVPDSAGMWTVVCHCPLAAAHFRFLERQQASYVPLLRLDALHTLTYIFGNAAP
jgi:hypothetical protein